MTYPIAPARVANLAALLHPRGARWKALAMLAAYFDASNTEVQRSQGVFAIGGYVATLTDWEGVEREWLKNLKYWNLERFHLFDVMYDMGQERGELCVRSFAQIVKGARGVYSGVMTADWAAIEKPPAFAARYPLAYHFCFDHILFQLSQWCRSQAPGEHVGTVFDQDVAGANKAAADAIFDTYLANPRHPNLTQGLTWSNDRAAPMLQTADLLAGVARKYWFDVEYPRDPASWLIESHELDIAQGVGLVGGVFDAAALKIAIDDFVASGEPFGPLRASS